MESVPERERAETSRANTEHGVSPRMCRTGSAGLDGVCQGAAVPVGDGERAQPGCQRAPFSRMFPGSGATLRGFAVDRAGNALLAGAFEGGLAFGAARLESAGDADAFVAKVDACGVPLWSRRFGDGAAQGALDVAAAGGHTLVLGDFSGTLDLGGRRLTASPAGGDLFLVKLGPDGSTRWAVQLSAEEGSILSGTALAADGSGGVLLLGRLEGAATIDGARIERRAIGAFVARLDASGRLRWASLPPSGSDSEEIGVEADERGNVLLAAQDARGTATFVTKLDPSGELLWHKRFRGSPEQLEEAYDLAVAPDGSALLSGSGVFGDPALRGGPRTFVARLSPEGDVRWVKGFGEQSPRRITAADERVVLAGDALCGATDESTSCSAWTAELSLSGEERWTQRIGEDVRVAGLKMDPWGSPILAGSFQGTLALGGDPLSSAEGALFLSRLPASP
ncbi:hypothetical protein [Sorangium cellulosum]|nr:hypothetical protein [Sorangium cellulosum]